MFKKITLIITLIFVFSTLVFAQEQDAEQQTDEAQATEQQTVEKTETKKEEKSALNFKLSGHLRVYTVYDDKDLDAGATSSSYFDPNFRLYWSFTYSDWAVAKAETRFYKDDAYLKQGFVRLGKKEGIFFKIGLYKVPVQTFDGNLVWHYTESSYNFELLKPNLLLGYNFGIFEVGAGLYKTDTTMDKIHASDHINDAFFYVNVNLGMIKINLGAATNGLDGGAIKETNPNHRHPIMGATVSANVSIMTITVEFITALRADSTKVIDGEARMPWTLSFDVYAGVTDFLGIAVQVNYSHAIETQLRAGLGIWLSFGKVDIGLEGDYYTYNTDLTTKEHGIGAYTLTRLKF